MKTFNFDKKPPTTTMQRIKGLMSGSLPTFIDAGSNFDSYIIEDDNLIKQAALNNKQVVILGDDTWLSLFESSLIKLHHTYPSFNIKDLDSNDLSVDDELKKILNDQSFEWNLIIAHYLGIDHCGRHFLDKRIYFNISF
jgi:phosphatidylinositol glycan class O